MKKILYVLLIIAVVIAAAVLFHSPRPGPGPEPAPEIVLNPGPEVAKKADKAYKTAAKVTIPKMTIDNLQPGQKETVTGKVILEDKAAGDIQETETPAEVSKDENGDIVVVTETEIAVFNPQESRWKVVMAHEGDFGAAYEVGRLRSPFGMALDLGIEGDIFLTQRRIGAGVSKKFRYGYIGVGESFDFGEEEFEPAVYAGVRINF